MSCEANLVITRSDGFRAALRLTGLPGADEIGDREARLIGDLVKLVGVTLVPGHSPEVLGAIRRGVGLTAGRLPSRIVVEFEACPVGAGDGGPT